MRKVEEAMRKAVEMRVNWKSGNTEVKVRKDSDTIRTTVYLHGNNIYEVIEDHSTGFKTVGFTLSGWDTLTTRSRLRALGVDVSHVNGLPYFKGQVIDDFKWYSTL